MYSSLGFLVEKFYKSRMNELTILGSLMEAGRNIQKWIIKSKLYLTSRSMHRKKRVTKWWGNLVQGISLGTWKYWLWLSEDASYQLCQESKRDLNEWERIMATATIHNFHCNVDFKSGFGLIITQKGVLTNGGGFFNRQLFIIVPTVCQQTSVWSCLTNYSLSESTYDGLDNRSFPESVSTQRQDARAAWKIEYSPHLQAQTHPNKW